MNEQSFIDWMKINTALSDSSIYVFNRIINQFLNEYQEVNILNINTFVSKGVRDKYCLNRKYAFKHYLKYLNKPIYQNIIPIKAKPRKKMGNYIDDSLVRYLIQNIKDKKFQDVATIHYATGARAREILGIKVGDIDFNYSIDTIRLKLRGKGGFEGITFLAKKYEQQLKKYIDKIKKLKEEGNIHKNIDECYLYINPETNNERFEIEINNNRTYYNNYLNKAAMSLNDEKIKKFTTHDFRRNVAEELKKNKEDIRTIKEVLRHKSISTTMIYFNDNPEEVKDAILRHQNT